MLQTLVRCKVISVFLFANTHLLIDSDFDDYNDSLKVDDAGRR